MKDTALRSFRAELDALKVNAKGAAAFDASQVYFGKQRDFVQDKAPFRTACTSRRAGKTEGAAGALTDSALKRAGSVNLYITLSRVNAKRIFWRTVKNLVESWHLGCAVNESDLSLRFPNDAWVYLVGAKDKTAIENFRGMPLGRVVIDEAQAMPAYIEELIDDVIEPGLMDYDGDLCLTGTPAPVPVGYFYRATKNLDENGKPLEADQWSNHAWTVFENPWIERKSGKPASAHLARALQRRGVTESDPSIQREFFGKWVYDPNALVFRWDAARNGYTDLPTGEWESVIGVDLGFDDADAIAVLGFARARPEAHLREESVLPKQTISQLAERLAALIDKHHPLAVVMDTGGLGKKIAEEMRRRFSLPIKAAERARKFEYIELLNDAMRTGRFFAKPDSTFARDCMLVEWDRDKSTNDRPAVSDRYHSDICDAVLYAFRESLHWLHQPEKQRPAEGTREYYDQVANEIEASMVERMELEAARARGEVMPEWPR